MEWYENQFVQNRVVGERSVVYSRYPRDPDCARRMHGIVPDAKLIYLVREPIERLRSQFIQHVYEFRETRSFWEVLQSIYRDEDREYLPTSMYYLQISQYLKFFARKQVCVLFSEDLAADPGGFFKRIFEFLDVDARCAIDTSVRENSSKIKRVPNKTLLKLMPQQLKEQLLWPTWMPGKAVIASKQVLQWTGRPLNRPTIQDDDACRLRELLSNDVVQLRDFVGRLPEAWGQY